MRPDEKGAMRRSCGEKRGGLDRFYILDVYEIVKDGEDGEAGGAVDAEFGAEIAAVGGHGVDGEAERIGYLFITHAMGHAAHYVAFALTEGIEAGHGIGIGGSGLGGSAFFVLTPQSVFKASHCRHEETALHDEVAHEVFLAGHDVEEGGAQARAVGLVVVVDEDIFQFVELGSHVTVIVGEHCDVEILHNLTLQQTLHIGENVVVLMLHMSAHLLHIIVEESDQQQRHLVGLRVVDGLDEFEAYLGESIVHKYGVGPLQVVYQSGEMQPGIGVLLIGDKITYGQKCGCIHIMGAAHLLDRTVAESERYAESADCHQQHVVMPDESAHSVGRHIFLILHSAILPQN